MYMTYVIRIKDELSQISQGNRSKVAMTFMIPSEHSTLCNSACNINVKRYVKVSYFLLEQRFKCIVKK